MMPSKVFIKDRLNFFRVGNDIRESLKQGDHSLLDLPTRISEAILVLRSLLIIPCKPSLGVDNFVEVKSELLVVLVSSSNFQSRLSKKVLRKSFFPIPQLALDVSIPLWWKPRSKNPATSFQDIKIHMLLIK